jgi:Na+:H+ antiporter, NhaA family
VPDAPPGLKPAPIQRVARPFQDFLRREEASGIVLVVCLVVALVCVNSPLADAYRALWAAPFELVVGELRLKKTIGLIINDGLMALFFFVVGLEIKRELLIGELASWKRASVPLFAALGGMVVPAALFVALNVGGEGLRGWAVPMATDIAFALGALALLGPRIPSGIRIFLAALAIVDDLGAVLVIGLFYSSGLNLGSLAAAGAVALLMLGANRAGVRNMVAYFVLGLVLWWFVLHSGLHATIAGVLAALTIPASPRIDGAGFVERARHLIDRFAKQVPFARDSAPTEEQDSTVHALERLTESVGTPLQRSMHLLHPWVAFGVMPLFALANAGVPLAGVGLQSFGSPVTAGVILGLVVGKPLGITLFTWMAVKLRLGALPERVGMKRVFGAACLGGIGFTMSLFISNLAYEGAPAMLQDSRLGILVASAVSAAVGMAVLSRIGERKPA